NSTTSSWLFPPQTEEVQLDEKWSFVFKKDEHCDPHNPADDQSGDWWDHTAYDPEHKLVLCVVPGARTAENAEAVVADVQEGTEAALARALGLSRVSRQVNVSFLERYHATDRHRNARKVRKMYTFSKDWQVHESMTFFTVYSYNFCWDVRTLAYRDEEGRAHA